MPTVLTLSAVYDRGLADLEKLVGVERLVFMLLDFDTLMIMEGWSHFFLHEHHFAWYAEMKDWLQQIGDHESLVILNEYESDVCSRGCEVSPEGIEELFLADDVDYYHRCADWCDRYSALDQARWAKAGDFLSLRGFELKMA